MMRSRTQRRCVSRLVAGMLAISLTGCATTVPYTGQGPHPQISRGRPVPPVDFLGNVFGLLSKLLLWNWKVHRHAISDQTESLLIDYLDSDRTDTDGTHFRLNEYDPLGDLSRLVKNRKVFWLLRIFPGLPSTLISDVLLPGRILGGLTYGDHYNPWTDTVHLYSDVPAVALHEAGHAHDVGTRRFKGLYSLSRILIFVDLYQENQATTDALRHLIETRQYDEEVAAYKMLYPAYGSYLGSYAFIPGGTLVAVFTGALVGHIVGRSKARRRARYYQMIKSAAPAP